MSIASAAILLVFVMDPVGNIPFFLAALKPVAPARQFRVVVRELLIAYGVMVVFLFAGRPLLGVLRISEPALTIAGGVILFLIALRMVFPPPGRAGHEEVAGEPFVVPLAIPYVAGPSLLATELLLMSREPERWGSWLAALSLAWLATAVILVLASRVRSVLGPRGMIAVERLMGMVLVAVAIQMFLSGVERYIGQLRPVEGAAPADQGPEGGRSDRPRNSLKEPWAFASSLAKGSFASAHETSWSSALASRKSTVSNPSVNQP